jgi:hypothetical protein
VQLAALGGLRAGAAGAAAEMAGIGAREVERGDLLERVLEIRRRQIARVIVRRVDVGDVFGEDALALLMSLHARAQHRKDRDIGNRHRRPTLG